MREGVVKSTPLMGLLSERCHALLNALRFCPPLKAQVSFRAAGMLTVQFVATTVAVAFGRALPEASSKIPRKNDSHVGMPSVPFIELSSKTFFPNV